MKGDASCPKDPLSPEDLRRIHAVVDFSDSKQKLLWIIILLAFRSLLRKSHFVATSENDREHLLRIRDISLHDWGCKITVQSSNTIQFGECSFDIPVHFCAKPLCVASLLRDLLADHVRIDSDFLFAWPLRPGAPPPPFHYNQALDQLKSWVSAAGISKDVGFHSLRRGAASYMHSLDIELVSIQQAGDWSSLCVLKYLTVDFAQKRKVESLVASSL